MKDKIESTVTKPVPFTSKILQQRHGNFEPNKIDGVNNSRGEGLPYSESPAKPTPYTSAILLARHGDSTNNIAGINRSRGEGLPFSEVETSSADGEIKQQDDLSTGKEGFFPPSTKLPSSTFFKSPLTSNDLTDEKLKQLTQANGLVSFSLKRS